MFVFVGVSEKKEGIVIKQISVQELKQKLDQNEKIILIDCREFDEYEFCRIQGSVCLPISEFEKRATKELSPKTHIVIHCHHGSRSQKACEYLLEKGYQNLTDVRGGIDAWSLHVDPKVARY